MKCKDCYKSACPVRCYTDDAECLFQQGTAKKFDWQSFRVEAAKDILAGILSHANICISEAEKTRLTKLALSYTEELIRQLKEKEEK